MSIYATWLKPFTILTQVSTSIALLVADWFCRCDVIQKDISSHPTDHREAHTERRRMTRLPVGDHQTLSRGLRKGIRWLRAFPQSRLLSPTHHFPLLSKETKPPLRKPPASEYPRTHAHADRKPCRKPRKQHRLRHDSVAMRVVATEAASGRGPWLSCLHAGVGKVVKSSACRQRIEGRKWRRGKWLDMEAFPTPFPLPAEQHWLATTSRMLLDVDDERELPSKSA